MVSDGYSETVDIALYVFYLCLVPVDVRWWFSKTAAFLSFFDTILADSLK
jgi:hypothetical protein